MLPVSLWQVTLCRMPADLRSTFIMFGMNLVTHILVIEPVVKILRLVMHILHTKLTISKAMCYSNSRYRGNSQACCNTNRI